MGGRSLVFAATALGTSDIAFQANAQTLRRPPQNDGKTAHLYQPHAQAVSGAWKFPSAQPPN